MNSVNKVIVLGDSGVGKSQLTLTLCDSVNQRPQSTVGCSIQIFPHLYRAGTPDECIEFVELWDIGGSTAHRQANYVFLDSTSGIIFIHDLSNSKSEQNLIYWHELFYDRKSAQSVHNFHHSPLLESSPINFLDVENYGTIPTLVVGTHSDILSFSKAHKQYALSVPTIKHYEHIHLDARKPIVPGSTNKLIFSKFFDAIIEKSQSPYKKSLANRRRRI